MPVVYEHPRFDKWVDSKLEEMGAKLQDPLINAAAYFWIKAAFDELGSKADSLELGGEEHRTAYYDLFFEWFGRES